MINNKFFFNTRKIIKILLINFSIILILILIPEFIYRGILATKYKNIKFMFDSPYEIKYQILFDKPAIEKINLKNQEKINIVDNCLYKINNKCLEHIYTLGGSTTVGNYCSENSSSWPEILSKKLDVKLTNLACNGCTDDDMLIKLTSENLKENSLIISSSRANLGDQLYLSQKDFLNPQIAFDNGLNLNTLSFVNILLPKINITLASVALTLRKYSTIVHDIISPFEENVTNGPARELRYIPSDKKLIKSFLKNPRQSNIGRKVILNNYLLNIYKFKKYSKDFNISVIALILPNTLSSDDKYTPGTLIKKTLSISKTNVINLENIFRVSKKNEKKYFCDTVHKTFAGNYEIANKLIEHLKTNFYIN